MDLFNGVLSKMALLAVLFAVVAAVDFPNNPARYVLKSFCHTLYHMSANHSPGAP